MGRLKRFYYWRELLFACLMLTVLILDIALFESLWPFGEDAGQSASVITAIR